MPDRARLARAQAANVLALVAIVMLALGLLTTEAARRRYQVQVRDYEALLFKERMKVRTCVTRRLDSLEQRITTIPNRQVNHAYQARLTDIRQHFAHVMRGQDTPACRPVACLPVPASTPTARADEPACALSEAEVLSARATAQQLAGLQAWVREHIGEQK